MDEAERERVNVADDHALGRRRGDEEATEEDCTTSAMPSDRSCAPKSVAMTRMWLTMMSQTT